MSPKKSVFRHAIALSLLLLFVLAGVQAAAAQQEQVFASTDGAVSIHAPAGWIAANVTPGAVYSATLIVAQDKAVLDTAVRAFTSGVPMATAPGSYAIVNVVTPQSWTMLNGDPQQAILAFLDAITRNNLTPDTTLTTNNVFSANLGGANAVVYDITTSQKLNSRGYLGGFVGANNTVILFQVVTSPITAFDQTSQLLGGIASTIRVPAEPGATVAPDPNAQPTAIAAGNLPTLPAGGLPTQAALPGQPTQAALGGLPTPGAPVASPVAAGGAMTVQRAAGDKLSLALPSGWTFIDQSADKNAVAFGDSQAAAQSRLDSTIPPAAGTAPVALTGSGGVVVLYPMSGFGVDPAAPNLSPLFDQLLNGLQSKGFKVEVPPRAITIGTVQGLIAVISGSETGFIVLAPFGDQIAYITGTGSGPVDAVIADQALQAEMGAIINSVRVPAEQPTPVAPTTGGLGGLQPATSPEAATGGLGGLAPAPTEAPSTGGLGGLVAAPAASPTP